MADVCSEAQLRAFLPAGDRLDVWCPALNAAMERFQITSTARAAGFLAQVAHESSEFRHLVENLSYSAPRLLQVWPRRFPTIDVAVPYERQPEKLANYVYASRLGNGDAGSGDGWRFRGRGLLQITGRDNYRAAARALGLPLEDQPEQLETPGVAALAAAQFWQSHGLNDLADERPGVDAGTNFETISVRINGGRMGLDARRQYWERAKTALT
jgi:putative chitinase